MKHYQGSKFSAAYRRWHKIQNILILFSISIEPCTIVNQRKCSCVNEITRHYYCIIIFIGKACACACVRRYHSSLSISQFLSLSFYFSHCIRNHRMPYNGKYHKRKIDARNKMSLSLYNDSLNLIATYFFVLYSAENCTRSKWQRTVSMFRSACIPLISFFFFLVMFQTNFEHTHTHFALLYHVSIHAQRKCNFSYISIYMCRE